MSAAPVVLEVVAPINAISAPQTIRGHIISGTVNRSNAVGAPWRLVANCAPDPAVDPPAPGTEQLTGDLSVEVPTSVAGDGEIAGPTAAMQVLYNTFERLIPGATPPVFEPPAT